MMKYKKKLYLAETRIIIMMSDTFSQINKKTLTKMMYFLILEKTSLTVVYYRISVFFVGKQNTKICNNPIFYW